jgi:hypothetical protein
MLTLVSQMTDQSSQSPRMASGRAIGIAGSVSMPMWRIGRRLRSVRGDCTCQGRSRPQHPSHDLEAVAGPTGPGGPTKAEWEGPLRPDNQVTLRWAAF